MRHRRTLYEALLLALLLLAPAGRASADTLAADDMADGSSTPTELVQAVLGDGVTGSNATYTGAPVAAGTFSGGTASIGFDSGIVLGTGRVETIAGPNTEDYSTAILERDGDDDLEALTGLVSQDAAVLEFDFVPETDLIAFQFVFSSEEYNESVGSKFDDVFGAFVNDSNCARVGEARVSVNTINNGDHNNGPGSHAGLFRNNDLDNGGGEIGTSMDGLTIVMTCNASVIPGQVNHAKFAISDTSDLTLDSNVFIRAGSFEATAPEICDGLDNDLDELVDEGFPNTDGDAEADCMDLDDDNDLLPDVHDQAPTDPDEDRDGLPDGMDVEHIQAAIRVLADEDFAPSKTDQGHRRAMLETLDQVEAAILAGQDVRAMAKLNDLRTRMDGCGGGPDADDWIITCPAQSMIRELVDILIANLEGSASQAEVIAGRMLPPV